MAEKEKRKNPAAVALGRKGGKRSRVNLTPEQRTELGRKAGRARWAKVKQTSKPGQTAPVTDNEALGILQKGLDTSWARLSFRRKLRSASSSTSSGTGPRSQ